MSFFRAMLMLALLAPLSCKKAKSVQSKSSGRMGHIVKLVLDPTLIANISTSYSSSAANLSVSPWVYREQCVPSRVPRCLSHAQCLTSGCIHPLTGEEDTSLEAKPIYYQLLVLHRVPRRKRKGPRGRTSRWGFDRGKRYDFRLGTEVVSVGCTCVRPSVLTDN